ncbi:MAG: FAD-dependent monooxygenase, partial [Deltaproteobacteria bacterium]|nr:FAD-dependent monooxygenase [Deltaproteobacteria bacterium]
MTEKLCDVLIIGAGPSGTTAAALMKKEGFDAVIVEKQQFPRFVIGESLLPRCMDLLEEAGMLQAVKERNYIVKNGAVFYRNDQCRGFNFNEQFTPGWDFAYQVPRDDFDQVLAASAEAQGVEILWQKTVTDVEFNDEGVITTICDEDGNEALIRSRFIFDASGYGRVLPTLLDLEAPSSLPLRQSLFTHVTGDIRPEGGEEGKIWICILPEENSWLWIIPFSNG